jgi:streptogramin lyase
MTTSPARDFPTPAKGRPTRIISGPDGNLWFIESDLNRVARITTKRCRATS